MLKGHADEGRFLAAPLPRFDARLGRTGQPLIIAPDAGASHCLLA